MRLVCSASLVAGVKARQEEVVVAACRERIVGRERRSLDLDKSNELLHEHAT